MAYGLQISTTIAPFFSASLNPPTDAALTITVVPSSPRLALQNQASILYQTKLSSPVQPTLLARISLYTFCGASHLTNSTPLPMCIWPKTCTFGLTRQSAVNNA